MNPKKRLLDLLVAVINRITKRLPCRPEMELKPSFQNQNRQSVVVMNNKLLSGKNALITGAGRNIGRSIALEMAKQGANIFFTDIDKERCIKLEQELNKYKVRTRGFLSDISKTEDSDSLYDSLLKDKINIDILVNNAGIQFETTTIKNLDLGEWHKSFNTNVFGPIYLTKLISQMMISNNVQGSVIFITSIHQIIPFKVASYSSAKAALGMIIKELALDLAEHKIRVNGIAPGFVTEDEQGNSLSFGYAPLHKTSINPHYIGRAAVYLASDYFSKFTTGTVIIVDAGLSLFHYQMVHDLFQQ
jgi:NAD(P)-dependent dehydrogenase (short-subunit alcohol dehydrogenase family)